MDSLADIAAKLNAAGALEAEAIAHFNEARNKIESASEIVRATGGTEAGASYSSILRHLARAYERGLSGVESLNQAVDEGDAFVAKLFM
jgi:hypothetical protein